MFNYVKELKRLRKAKAILEAKGFWNAAAIIDREIFHLESEAGI